MKPQGSLPEGMLTPADLEREGIHTVIVATPDLQGRLNGRRIPVDQFDRVVTHGVEVCTTVWAWDIEQTIDLISAGSFALSNMGNGVPDVLLRPDLTTLRRAAWLDGVAIVMADPEDLRTGEPMSISPRVILKKQLAELTAQGLTPQVGTELEFYLFRNEPRTLRLSGFRDLEPTTLAPSDFLIHEGNAYEPFFRKLRADLKASGIRMEAAQSEWGTGQWEMTFVYGEALEMADRHALYKLAVRDSAVAAGLSVTFMARPITGQPGSSCHVHCSLLDQDGTAVFWAEDTEHNLSPTMTAAIGGVLAHAPELMAWYAPTVNSYRRINSEDVAGFGRTWGIENRSASVRVVGHSPEALRFEFRLPGADTNPYLTVAGVLASVSDGIANDVTPPPMTVRSAYEGAADDAMPAHLSAAAAMFGASPFVQNMIGDEDRHHFQVLAEYEWNSYQTTVSDWDLQRYFDRI
jgi:glutamine synthetase